MMFQMVHEMNSAAVSTEENGFSQLAMQNLLKESS